MRRSCQPALSKIHPQITHTPTPSPASFRSSWIFGDMFPEEYQGDLFVAYHGSWNRKEPTDYKIVTIDMNELEINDFATGWLKESNVLGRPVDIITNDDGSLFVSDDNAGKVYRVYYEK